MTDKELQGIAAQSFNLARRDLEKGCFNFVLASYFSGEGLKRLKSIERAIIDQLGEDWLNHGRTKDVGFQILRICVDTMPPEAVVFVTGVNMFHRTEKLRAMGPEAEKALMGPGSTHNQHHAAVKEGLLTVHDGLTAVAQTPERVCIYQQMVDRRYRPIDQPQTNFFDQETFGGRLKMFGVEKEETVQ